MKKKIILGLIVFGSIIALLSFKHADEGRKYLFMSWGGDTLLITDENGAVTEEKIEVKGKDYKENARIFSIKVNSISARNYKIVHFSTIPGYNGTGSGTFIIFEKE